MSLPQILIVDDEGPARGRLEDLLTDINSQFPHVIRGEARTGEEALEQVNAALLSPSPINIVLMDIQMPVMSGLEAAQHLSALPPHLSPAVIFCTAYDQHALQAFEVNAVDYLLKPVREERLLAALRKSNRPITPTLAEQLNDKARKHLSAIERGRVQLIPIQSVLYLRAELKYVTVKTAEREFIIEDSLTKLEDEFGERFVRLHRNCLAAREYITGFERGLLHEKPQENSEADADAESETESWFALIGATGERLTVSRRQAHVVREIVKSAKR
jgi:two-component system, LytTR family, response regulator AlgR